LQTYCTLSILTVDLIAEDCFNAKNLIAQDFVDSLK
jgi:hypothetical protein